MGESNSPNIRTKDVWSLTIRRSSALVTLCSVLCVTR